MSAPTPLIFGKFTLSQAIVTCVTVFAIFGGAVIVFVVVQNREPTKEKENKSEERGILPPTYTPPQSLLDFKPTALNKCNPVNLDDVSVINQHVQLSNLPKEEAKKTLVAKNIAPEEAEKILEVSQQIAKAAKLKKDLEDLKKFSYSETENREEVIRIQKELENTIKSTPQINISQETAKELNLQLLQDRITAPKDKDNTGKKEQQVVVVTEELKKGNKATNTEDKPPIEPKKEEKPAEVLKLKTTTSVVDSPKVEKPLTEDDRLRLQTLAQEPKNVILSSVTEAAVKEAFEKSVKTLADLQLLNFVLPSLDEKLRVTVTIDIAGGKAKMTRFLSQEMVIDALLPAEVKKQKDQREQLMQALFADPDNPGLQKQCVDAHKALFDSLASASSYIKQQLSVVNADISKEYCKKFKDELIFDENSEFHKKRSRALNNLCPSP